MPVFRVQIETSVVRLHTVMVETDRPGPEMEDLAIEAICNAGNDPDSLEVTNQQVVWWQEVKREDGQL